MVTLWCFLLPPRALVLPSAWSAFIKLAGARKFQLKNVVQALLSGWEELGTDESREACSSTDNDASDKTESVVYLIRYSLLKDRSHGTFLLVFLLVLISLRKLKSGCLNEFCGLTLCY